MGRLFQPLLFLLARCSHNELIRHIEFLKAKNEMLRKRMPRQKITLNHEERARLIKLGQAIGPAAKHLITIVHPHTYRRWLWREEEPCPEEAEGPSANTGGD